MIKHILNFSIYKLYILHAHNKAERSYLVNITVVMSNRDIIHDTVVCCIVIEF